MEIRQILKLKQELHLTPQLIQSIKFLQYSATELVEEIKKELMENPVLEEDYDKHLPLSEAQVEVADPISERTEANDFSWEDYLKNQGKNSGGFKTRNPDHDDLFSPDKKESAPETLQDHLLWQSKLSFDFEIDQQIALLLIEQINSDGFLDLENQHREALFDDIQQQITKLYGDDKVDHDDIQEVLEGIQTFDPVGCGARNKIETLLIQAKQYNYPEYVQNIIAYNLEDLANRKVPFLKDKYNLKQREVLKALELIRALEPIPGRNYFSEEPRYIEPDLYLRKEDGEYKIYLNNEMIPELKVSNYYRDELSSPSADNETKSYIRERLQAAKWVMDSIQQRQRTIRKVMEAILYFQLEFFDHGIAHLKPITLKDVAAYIEMNESTVSRVTSNKYVHTDRGLFSLKYFFSSAVNVSGGESVSSKSVKNIIQQLIKEEDRKKPLSDAKLVKILKEEYNFNLTRRTVANYRTSLGILSSSKRKQFV